MAMTGKEKKAQRKANKVGLRSFYTMIKNDRTNYTKLVSRDRAIDYLKGRLGYDHIRTLHLKDQFTEIAIKGKINE